jgi:hypothetical protein
VGPGKWSSRRPRELLRTAANCHAETDERCPLPRALGLTDEPSAPSLVKAALSALAEQLRRRPPWRGRWRTHRVSCSFAARWRGTCWVYGCRSARRIPECRSDPGRLPLARQQPSRVAGGDAHPDTGAEGGMDDLLSSGLGSMVRQGVGWLTAEPRRRSNRAV